MRTVLLIVVGKYCGNFNMDYVMVNGKEIKIFFLEACLDRRSRTVVCIAFNT